MLPWAHRKNEKTIGFPMFPGSMEEEHWGNLG